LFVQKGLPLSKGLTRCIAEGQTKLLGKLIDVSASAKEKAMSQSWFDCLTNFLISLCINGEYKVRITENI